MMMRTIKAPESKQATTLLVAVRCRPITAKEKDKSRDILRVVDDKVVVVLDPDTNKEYLDRVQGRSKEKRYAFDIAFGANATNKDVYQITVSNMVERVVEGLNATVFAYGATGSGKTHTMAGTPEDPGLMVLSLQAIFNLISKQEAEHEFDVTCSYLEVYNEVIYDLLEPNSQHLELRDSPDQGITVFGLKRIQVSSAEKILELLNQGNARRKTESTDANATSSRSHAVLEIIVKRKQRNMYRAQVLQGKLALVDLAGSERASETNNAGQKLRDGANINRSLLALANCINALGKQQKRGLAYVPYRNSKLTRLLKDGLSGNSRTVMVATVSSGDDQYQQTINTLKYADRAKEIKTHIQTNIGTVDAHVADYQRMIDNLQGEVSQLRRELTEKETQLSARTSEKTADDELSWLDVLSQNINENVEERINLQKALFELEDTNLHNRTELQKLDDLIAEGKSESVNSESHDDHCPSCWAQSLSTSIVQFEDLRDRRQVVLDNIRENDEAGAHIRQDIEHNEAQRKQLQRMIDDAISSDRNKTFLRILSQYRLLGMSNMELQYQIAVRDQIIHDHQENLKNLWLVLEGSGLNHHNIMKVAAQQGIMIEERIMSPSRGLVPVSPAPAAHKQPVMAPAGALTTTTPRYPSASPDVGLAKDNSIWYDNSTLVPSESELPAGSPRTPSRDGRRNVRAVDDSYSNMKSWNNLERVATPRSKFQDRTFDVDGGVYSSGCHHSTGFHNPEKLRRIKTPGSVRGRSAYVGQEQCTSCMFNRGRSPPVVLEDDVSLPWQKRRPRSAESCTRQVFGGDDTDMFDRDNTTGIDAGSERSDTEEDQDNRDRWTGARPDKASALDNDMLRKKLSRLDDELQDLKRGMDGKSTMRWNSGVTNNSISMSEADTVHSGRQSTASYSGLNKSFVPTTPSGFADGHAALEDNGGSNGNLYQDGPTYLASPTGIWDKRSSLGGRESLDSAMNIGLDNGPRVSTFGSGELLEGHSSMIAKVKVIRHKTKIGTAPLVTRQMWPRQVSEWK